MFHPATSDPSTAMAGLPHLMRCRLRSEPALAANEVQARAMLEVIRLTAGRLECAVHAYSIHGPTLLLLVTPRRGNGAPMLLSHLLEHRTIRERSGGGRTPGAVQTRMSVVQPAGHVLACYRYVDEREREAGALTAGYACSSLPGHLLGMRDPLITDHQAYRSLGDNPAHRSRVYARMRESCADHISNSSIERALANNAPIGSAQFQRRLARMRAASTPAAPAASELVAHETP